MKSKITRIAYLFSTVAAVTLGGTAGCDSAGPRTYPVRGQVTVAGGDASVLSGHALEASWEQDSSVRAFSESHEDGHFALQTLRGGSIREGAPEGQYRARIVLSDDDPGIQRRAAKAIHARYLEFGTSGLSFHVPTTSDVTLQLSRN